MSTATPGTLLRLAAFTTDPAGGNPAGVWIGDDLPPAAEMQRIAAEVGYSETAFLAPDGSGEPGRLRVRYFSPLAEVPFCGHATIAAGVALAAGGFATPGATAADPRQVVLTTNDGEVPVGVTVDGDGLATATLTSVEPWVRDAPAALVDRTLDFLDWRLDELDPSLPPAIAFAGAKHLVLAVADLETLGRMAYPFELMKALMHEHDLTTIQLVWREGPRRFRARDPFAVGGVVEDPATGAAAAAFGAYLRHVGAIEPPATFEIVQGVEMGRPSRLTVEDRDRRLAGPRLRHRGRDRGLGRILQARADEPGSDGWGSLPDSRVHERRWRVQAHHRRALGIPLVVLSERGGGLRTGRSDDRSNTSTTHRDAGHDLLRRQGPVRARSQCRSRPGPCDPRLVRRRVLDGRAARGRSTGPRGHAARHAAVRGRLLGDRDAT